MLKCLCIFSRIRVIIKFSTCFFFSYYVCALLIRNFSVIVALKVVETSTIGCIHTSDLFDVLQLGPHGHFSINLMQCGPT